MKKLILIFGCLFTLQGCATPNLTMDPLYTPTNIIAVPFPNPTSNAFNTAITIYPLEDRRRHDQKLIGENREKDTPRPIYSNKAISAFTTDTLKQAFATWGGKTSNNSDISLHGEIVQLFVIETHLYVAEVRINFYLKDKQGKVIWEGSKYGKAKRFGKSMASGNYNEVLSDALRESFSQLFSDEMFCASWTSRNAGKVSASGQQGVEPTSLKDELIKLITAGFDEATLLGHIKQTKLSRKLTANELIEWKKSGIPIKVINQLLAEGEH